MNANSIRPIPFARRRLARAPALAAVCLAVLAVSAPSALAGETIAGEGLGADAVIRRDAYGVPHIDASSLEDALFAQGYAAAGDRLLQMDFFRRVAQGTVSELAGMLTLSIDEGFRKFGFGRLARKQLERTDPAVVRLLERFADGINHYVKTHRDEVMADYKPLGARPAPWKPEDSLAVYYLISWGLAESYTEELLAERMFEAVGPEKMEALLNARLDDETLITALREDNGGLFRKAERSRRALDPVLDEPSQIRGSNNWVVDGTMTKSGRPILANDPHLALFSPSIWWESHLKTPENEVWGASIPGTPGISIGFNRRFAWGITNFGGDVQDLFVEKVDPNNPNRYEHMGEWKDMEVVEEEIRYKSGKSMGSKKFVLRSTVHGPIVEGGKDRALALAWTAYDPADELSAFFGLAKAASVGEAAEALRSFGNPPLNFVFADVEGNVAYYCGGRIPIRKKGDGSFPVPGWTGEYDWTGYVPFEDMPRLVNPARHFAASANNKAVPDGGPHRFGNQWSWDIGYRARRISDLLTQTAPHDVDTFAAIQADTLSLFARDYVPFLLESATPEALNALESELRGAADRALEAIRAWDLKATRDSVAVTVFQQWFDRLAKNVMDDDLARTGPADGELSAPEYNSGHFAQLSAALLLGERNRPTSLDWFDDKTTPEVRETPRDMAAKSFVEAVRDLSKRLGPDPSAWRWGGVHQVTFENPLERFGLAKSLGPFPNDGAPFTVDVAPYHLKKPFSQNFGPSFRLIVELTDPPRAIMVNGPGQGGMEGDPHFADQLDLWLNNAYRPVLTEWEQVVKDAVETIVLKTAEMGNQ